MVTTERRSRTRRDRWFHRVRLPDERLLQHRLEDYNKLTPSGKKTQFYSVLQLIDVTGRGCTVFARPRSIWQSKLAGLHSSHCVFLGSATQVFEIVSRSLPAALKRCRSLSEAPIVCFCASPISGSTLHGASHAYSK